MVVQAVLERELPQVIPVSSDEAPGDAAAMTGKDLFELGDIGQTELIKGELVRMPPTGHPHGYIKVNFAAILHTFVRQHKLGCVMGGEVGIYTHRDPDTVRGADVVFISNERLAQVQSDSYLDIAPELIVEITSPNDRWHDIDDKLTEYFGIGVQIVWVANPHRKQIHVYRSLTEIEILTVDDTLSGNSVLPGFGMPVAELFE